MCNFILFYSLSFLISDPEWTFLRRKPFSYYSRFHIYFLINVAIITALFYSYSSLFLIFPLLKMLAKIIKLHSTLLTIKKTALSFQLLLSLLDERTNKSFNWGIRLPSRTSENVDAMINQCERVFAEPISSAIKKSQSSPLSQKLCWHECQADVHSSYPRRPLQTRHQRRIEHDRYLFRMKGDAANSELANEDIAACSKYARAVKSSLKKRNRCRQPEVPNTRSSMYEELFVIYDSEWERKKRNL